MQPAVERSADADAQPLHVGVAGQDRGGGGGGQLRLTGDEVGDLAEGRRDAVDRGGGAVDVRDREAIDPAGEHLGDEVVLRAEVGVRRGRRDAGPPGHVAHGEPVVPAEAELLDRGVDERVDAVGLASPQVPAAHLRGRRAGHVSGQ